jgi:hypothetical protein
MGALTGQRGVQVSRLDLPRVKRHAGQAGMTLRRAIRDIRYCCAQELAEP